MPRTQWYHLTTKDLGKDPIIAPFGLGIPDKSFRNRICVSPTIAQALFGLPNHRISENDLIFVYRINGVPNSIGTEFDTILTEEHWFFEKRKAFLFCILDPGYDPLHVIKECQELALNYGKRPFEPLRMLLKFINGDILLKRRNGDSMVMRSHKELL